MLNTTWPKTKFSFRSIDISSFWSESIGDDKIKEKKNIISVSTRVTVTILLYYMWILEIYSHNFKDNTPKYTMLLRLSRNFETP